MSGLNDANNFLAGLKEYAETFNEEQFDLIIRRTASDMHNRVVMRTPFDTGRAAGGWMLELKKLYGATTNTVPYIEELERGHSKQAPKGFAAITIEEIKKELQEMFS